MAFTRADRALYGIKPSESRHISRITPHDLRSIMLEIAETIRQPNAFTNDAVSLNADGKHCSLFTSEAVQCDLLGWIIKLSYERWPSIRTGRKNIGYMVSMYIDSHLRTVSGGKLRLLTLGEAGFKFASMYLKQAALALDLYHLPQLFTYAKYYETEEERSKRWRKKEEPEEELAA